MRPGALRHRQAAGAAEAAAVLRGEVVSQQTVVAVALTLAVASQACGETIFCFCRIVVVPASLVAVFVIISLLSWTSIRGF
jgi:hypothetical protein